MEKIISWLRNLCPGSETDEGKSILPKSPSAEDKESYYASISEGDSADVSCVPCTGIASRDSVTCPTCQGTGRIPREQEQQLVALIPYGDQRLKPRRTKLYVTLTVAICLLMTCLMMYFLFPRSIAVIPSGLNASSISFDNFTSSITLNMTNILNVTNNNFYTVHVAQLALEVLHKTLVIGKNTVMTQLDIRPLQGAQAFLSYPYILENVQCVVEGFLGCMAMFQKHSLLTFRPHLWQASSEVVKSDNMVIQPGKFTATNVLENIIQGTLTCSYLSHTEQLSFENYQYVDCRGNAIIPIMS